MTRKILFWTHLVCGVAAGVFVAIMSFTGAALTFEKEIVAWVERDARRVDAPPGAARLPLDELIARVRAAAPGARIASLTVTDDPADAVAFGLGGNRTLWANPCTGEVREGSSPRTRAFMQTMRSWHTHLAIPGQPGSPSLGARLNGAANLVFVFLGLTGLVLWWPQAWNLRALRPSLWFNADARGKARDWNWHNVVGFWSLPMILILAGSGVVMSYRWAGDLVFRLAGETPLPNLAPPPPKPAARAAPLTPGGAALTSGALFAAVQKRIPDFASITLRFNPPLGPAPAAAPRNFSAVVKTKNPWPPFAADTLTLDGTTGEVIRTETFADLSTGLRARRWIRLLHSGEALGRLVQLLSGLACLGGCVLVYTGFALAWRRFFARPVPPVENGS